MTDPACYVTSDLHLGAGGRREDFTQEPAFVDWAGSLPGPGSTLVLNGDLIDFAQTPPFPDLGLPRSLLWDQATSVAKLEAVIACHRPFFQAVGGFLDRGGTLVVAIGNHDLDLAWPEIQARFRREVGVGGDVGDRVAFTCRDHRYEGVVIRHGHQETPENCPVDPEAFIHEHGGVRYLEKVWGTDLVLSVLNGLRDDYPFAFHVKPAPLLALAGLRNGWIKGSYLVALAAFAKRAKLPRGVLSIVLDAGDVPLELLEPAVVAAAVDDEAWRTVLMEVLASPDGVAELEAGLAELDPSLRKALASDVETDVRILTEVDRDVEPGDTTTLRLFRDSREVEGARRLVDAGARHVVMGHTHRIVDGKDLGRGAAKLFNPGTWIGHRRIDGWSVTEEDLTDGSSYTHDLRAVCIPEGHPDDLHLVAIPKVDVPDGP